MAHHRQECFALLGVVEVGGLDYQSLVRIHVVVNHAAKKIYAVRANIGTVFEVLAAMGDLFFHSGPMTVPAHEPVHV
eukprot:CAMPEP_0171314008 /NCGR_PEP_ID=MMETSP0816-20121228/47712_1 /TAXON_ID=420281 /ORGANISM="Proboscia inermis, Strain CCAP1064/1" /LENGTH=76 /DNA_ID=CAMNT_0011802295 /DNA_START=329 /DNA_END=555 /DNA_ORIENTATION=-